MSFETLRGVNGWKVEGADDLGMLENDPSLFVATKADWKLALHRTIIVEKFSVQDPPSVGEQTTQEHPGYSEWRLRWNDHDVQRGRSLEDILEKTERFMRYK